MIALTGAGGRLGRLVVEELAQLPSAPPWRALSRDPAAAAAGHPRVPHGTFAGGDFDDPVELERALAGVERLLLISTPDPNEQRVRRQVAALDAARRAGVGQEDEYRGRAGAALGPMLEPFLQIWRTVREGWFDQSTPDAARLAGAELTSVDAWLAEHASLFEAPPPA